MTAASSPSQVQTLLQREATALTDKVLWRWPFPTPAESHFSGGSPLKAHPGTHSQSPHGPGGWESLWRGLLAGREGEKGLGKSRTGWGQARLKCIPLALLPRRPGRSLLFDLHQATAKWGLVGGSSAAVGAADGSDVITARQEAGPGINQGTTHSQNDTWWLGQPQKTF